LPFVVCIGAQRCGTTWLAECLADHPEVSLCTVKDVHFFRSWDEQPALCDGKPIEFYHGLFDDRASARVRVDVSAGLLGGGTQTARRMQPLMPDCRFVAILRDPVERAASHYTYLSGRVELPYGLRELAEDPRLPDPHEILRDGFYARRLEEFFEFYPRDRFLVLLYDDLLADPRAFLRKVYTFLDVDPELEPSQLNHRINEPRRVRSKVLYRLQVSLGSYFLRRGLHRLRKLAKRLRLPEWVGRLNERRLERQPIDLPTRRALRDLYRSDVERLSTLISRDLAMWLADEPARSEGFLTK